MVAVAETSRQVGSKRKLRASSNLSSKRSKIQHRSADDLPWSAVARPNLLGAGRDDGILDLEEVEGVEVVYEITDSGKVARFNVLADDSKHECTNKTPSGQINFEQYADIEQVQNFDSENLLPNWHPLPLHPQLLRAIHIKGFKSPTPIQAEALPKALAGRDVVGVAQTGSGKTLAYGLPILQYIISQPRPLPGKRRAVRALILAPTRELALQVSSHLNELMNHAMPGENLFPVDPNDSNHMNGKPEGKWSGATEMNVRLKKLPPQVSVATLVGGMSSQKQRRILDRGVDVLVATPGRLWDIMEDDDTLSREIKSLKFLVLDEADRMIEAGHFAELDNILRLTLRDSVDDRISEESDVLEPDTKEEEKDILDRLQTFVFSATLSKDLQRNFTKRSRPNNSVKYRKKQEAPATTLDDLLMRLDFRDPEPEIIDLSPEGNVVSSLQQGKIECLSADKDVYLYYFLLRYPGRSLVFLSSIDGIRRLMPLVELLNIKAFPLHSQLEQRQRLKNLDRFRNTPSSVLLATDIAARGLDIPAVDHVVHFQIPRTADSYVHRNGRTARATLRGFSMLMCAPDERRLVKALLNSLGREDSEIPEMHVELSLLDRLKTRVQLARQIEQSHHKIKKTNHERNWMKQTAEALEVELDSDFISDSEDENKVLTQKRKFRDGKTAALKAELKRLLSQPLVARGISTRYITSGSRPIVEDLLAGKGNEHMVGLRKMEAGDDLVVPKKKIVVTSGSGTDEEWDGIEGLA